MFEQYKELFIESAMKYGSKIALAIITLVIGLWVISMITNTVGKLMNKKSINVSLRPFIKSLLGGLLKTLLVLSVLSILGIEVTSFIAVLGAAGLAVGMALSGTLQNFAGGVMILILRPFKVGDVINAQGYSGVVKEIQIFCTFLTTPDNKTVIIPNAPLANGALINFSAQDVRRVDITFAIGYSDDYTKAKAIIEKHIGEDSRILTEPAPVVGIADLTENGVKIALRYWLKTSEFPDDHAPVTGSLYEKVKADFTVEGFSLPYQKRHIYIHQ